MRVRQEIVIQDCQEWKAVNPADLKSYSVIVIFYVLKKGTTSHILKLTKFILKSLTKNENTITN